MLDDFKNNSFYKYAKELKKIYHAYIFEVDDINNSFPLILAFAKMIICKNHYTNSNNCHDCNICNLINNNSYADLKILEPTGITIKKEQILELKKSLSLKSFNDTNQVYIIKNAEKLNPSAANSLLKFIEEPLDGVYAILITTNKKQLLTTIISRCIVINLKENNPLEYDLEEVNNLSKYLNLIITKKENSLPYTNQMFLQYYSTRDKVIEAFDLLEVILDILIKNYYQIDLKQSKEIYDMISQNINDYSMDDLTLVLRC